MGSIYLYEQVILKGVLRNDGKTRWDDDTDGDDDGALYTFMVPVICLVGIIGNLISILVFLRKELKASIYIYLAVLSGNDLLTAIFIFLSSLSEGILNDQYKNWRIYQSLIFLPFGGFISCFSVFITIAITFDRLLLLYNPFRTCKPKLCHKPVAKKVAFWSLVVSLVFNLPYCFILAVDENGKLVTTPFFNSEFYWIHTWSRMILFAIIPVLILIFGNAFLIHSYRKARKTVLRCRNKKDKKRLENIKFATILISTIFVFLMSTIPVQILSRSTVISIAYRRDPDKVNMDDLYTSREVSTITAAIGVSVNFFIYYFLCPSFALVLKKMLRKKKAKGSLQVNVFLLDRMEKIDNVQVVSHNNIMKIIAEAREKSSDSESSESRPECYDEQLDKRETWSTGVEINQKY